MCYFYLFILLPPVFDSPSYVQNWRPSWVTNFSTLYWKTYCSLICVLPYRYLGRRRNCFYETMTFNFSLSTLPARLLGSCLAFSLILHSHLLLCSLPSHLPPSTFPHFCPFTEQTEARAEIPLAPIYPNVLPAFPAATMEEEILLFFWDHPSTKLRIDLPPIFLGRCFNFLENGFQIQLLLRITGGSF